MISRDGKVYSLFSHKKQFPGKALRFCGRAALNFSISLLISLTEVMLLYVLRVSTDAALIFIRWPSLVQPASLRLARRLADCIV